MEAHPAIRNVAKQARAVLTGNFILRRINFVFMFWFFLGYLLLVVCFLAGLGFVGEQGAILADLDSPSH